MNNIKKDAKMESFLPYLRDPKFYLEHFCKIKGKVPGKLIPFILNEAQKNLFNALNKSCRIMVRKARQLGLSTGISGFFYHDTITHPGTTTALIGYNSSLTAELLDKIKTFYKTTPAELRPTIYYNSKYEISFPKIDSKILVLPSTENVGRGYTLSNVLVTELSSWDRGEEKMMALEASVPINGRLVIESSPKGLGNLYHKLWVSDNEYVKKDYGWWWGYSKTDIEIIRKRMNNDLMFAQEYCLEFLSSGRPVFDSVAIRKQRKNVLKTGDKYKDKEGVEHMVEERDGWIFYKKPKVDCLYVCGVDTSEGIIGGDYAVVTIWERKSGEQVAFYRGLMAPDILGDKLNKIGREYNNALMVVEVNAHGLTTMAILKRLLYPSLFFRPSKYDSMGASISNRLGWRTNSLTRPLLIDDLAQALRDEWIVIRSKEILDEMQVFQYDENGNPRSMSGYYDDAVFSSGIALQGFKVMYDKPLTQLEYSDHFIISR